MRASDTLATDASADQRADTWQSPRAPPHFSPRARFRADCAKYPACAAATAAWHAPSHHSCAMDTPARVPSQPSRGTQQPSRRAREPSRGTQQPARVPPQPSRRTQQPSRVPQQPSRGTREPAYEARKAPRATRADGWLSPDAKGRGRPLPLATPSPVRKADAGCGACVRSRRPCHRNAMAGEEPGPKRSATGRQRSDTPGSVFHRSPAPRRGAGALAAFLRGCGCAAPPAMDRRRFATPGRGERGP
jgi:hypothetical protein